VAFLPTGASPAFLGRAIERLCRAAGPAPPGAFLGLDEADAYGLGNAGAARSKDRSG
jgi:hypothetical protein